MLMMKLALCMVAVLVIRTEASPTKRQEGLPKCIELTNAQEWPDLINGQYFQDPTLSTCGTGLTSYRQIGGNSFLWAKKTASGNTQWIGTTAICQHANSGKQLYGKSTTESPLDIPKEQFFVQNARRNGWLTTKGLEAVPCGLPKCVELKNAQEWGDLINGKYVLDSTLSTCGTELTSYRQVGGNSFLWPKKTASGNTQWIGTTAICQHANSGKQLYGKSSTESPLDITKEQFFVQNARRNGWLTTKGLEAAVCYDGMPSKRTSQQTAEAEAILRLLERYLQ